MSQVLVVQTQSAENKTEQVLVLVSRTTTEILTRDVVQNVFSILIAHQTKLVLEINVSTLVQEIAAKTPFVKSSITCHLVTVFQVSLEILIESVLF